MIYVRDPEQPPCDSRAEDKLLSFLIMHPDRIGDVDLAPDIYFPEHRVIWQAMVRVHMRTPGLTFGHFLVALRRELHSMKCHGEPAIGPHEERCEGWRYLKVPTLDPSHPENLDYWRDRLRRCTEARRLIAAAQSIAERSWHVPERPFTAADASDILEKAMPAQRPTIADRVLRL